VNKHILVTYATRTGSTVEVAAAIGETLRARGCTVDVKPIKEKPAVHGYDAVLVGSAIRYGQWLPEAVTFVKTNQQALNRLPVALFTVHIMNRGDDEQSQTKRMAYLNAVCPLLHPVDEVFFAGKGDPAQFSLIEHLIGRIISAPVGDFRDWDKIRGWAQTVLA
jgi:menaquinone-dependent protoporphyrinogen oxidase